MRRRRSKSQEKSRSATNESTTSHGDKEVSDVSIPDPATVETGSEPSAETATEDSIPIPESDSIPQLQAGTTTISDDLNVAQNSNTEDPIPIPQEINSIPEEGTASDKLAETDGSTSKADTNNAPQDETVTDLSAEKPETKEPIHNPQDPIPTDEQLSTDTEEKDSEPTKNDTVAES